MGLSMSDKYMGYLIEFSVFMLCIAVFVEVTGGNLQ